MSDELLAARLKRARHHAGVSQGVVSRALECYPQEISAYENGGTVPRNGRIVELARLYGVSPGWLLFGDTEVTMPPTGGEEAS